MAQRIIRTKHKKESGLPSKSELLDFIRNSSGKVGKREVAQAFGIKGPAKIALKSMLKELARDGEVERSSNRRYAPRGGLPDVVMVEVTGIDRGEGEALARPLDWSEEGHPPTIRIRGEGRGGVALEVGDRALVRIERREHGAHIARVMRRIEGAPEKVLGVYNRGPDGSGRLMPTEKKLRIEFVIAPGNAGDARPGELVLAEVLSGRRLGLPQRADRRAAWRHREPQGGEPHRDPRRTASRSSSRRAGAGAGRGARGRRRSASATICARCRWSPSTARTRAISTTRSWPSPTPIRRTRAAGTCRRHRRRRLLCAARRRARPRGARARQLGLFPRPRRADAAGGAVQRSVLAAAAARTAPAWPSHLWIDARRQQAPPPFRARHHALGGAR